MSEKSIWSTRHSLLNRISDPKDQGSWNEFISRYEQYVYNILRSAGLDPDEADDLRQNIFIKLWKIMPESPYQKDKGKFRSWFATLIKNEAINYMQKQINRRDLMDKNKGFVKEQIVEHKTETELERIIQDEWENHLVIEAWSTIKGKLKEPLPTIFQHALDGKTNAEIAELCKLNPKNVKVYKQRVKDLLKNEVNKNREMQE